MSGCAPKNLVAITRAANQVSGDIMSEAERIANFTGEQMAHYERAMAHLLGRESLDGKKYASPFDALKKYKATSEAPATPLDARFHGHPSELLPKRFYNAVDKKLTAWANKKGGDYQEMVGKPVKTLLKAIDKVVTESGSKTEAMQGLNKLGLKLDDVYEARDWLKWIGDGGPTQKAKWMRPINTAASNLSKAQAVGNPLWILGNAIDLIRPYSYYLTKYGPETLLRGTSSVLKDARGNLFRQTPTLKSKGIYGSAIWEREISNNSPFAWSVTAQKNLVGHLAMAAGEDPSAAITKQLFDPKPWDRPRYDRSPEAQIVWQLARYPINEARWIYSTTASALQGDATAMANLGVYSLAKAVLVGPSSLIPALYWHQVMSKDEREQFKAGEENGSWNLLGKATTALLSGVGAKIDLSEYTQPGGGTIGARAGGVVNTFNAGVGGGIKAGREAVQGKLPAAAAHSAAAVIALRNLWDFKFMAGKLDPVNSTMIAKMFDTLGDELAGEFSRKGKFEKELLKDAFGPSVKSTKGSVVNMRQEADGIASL